MILPKYVNVKIFFNKKVYNKTENNIIIIIKQKTDALQTKRKNDKFDYTCIKHQRITIEKVEAGK